MGLIVGTADSVGLVLGDSERARVLAESQKSGFSPGSSASEQHPQ